MRYDPRHRFDRERRQGRRAISDREIRQADIGKGEGIAVERFRRLQIEERIVQHAGDEARVRHAAGRGVTVIVV
jgi:hypothetical protein